MHFTKAIVTLACAASALAVPTWEYPRAETNGQRMARGMKPLAPRTLFNPDRTKVARASPSQAPSGAQCCQNVTNSNAIDSVTSILLGLLGINVSDLNVPIGTGCTPISVLGGVSCNTNTVTCGQVFAPQAIGINCIPVIINA